MKKGDLVKIRSNDDLTKNIQYSKLVGKVIDIVDDVIYVFWTNTFDVHHENELEVIQNLKEFRLLLKKFVNILINRKQK